MGVPVLTKIGAAFQSRMAASVLQAAGLPDLISLDIKAYEDMAVKIALDKEHHGDLLNRLKNNINTSLLFDIDQFKNSIEKAFRIALKRNSAQEPLDHIEIN
jgi:predicted O-linked N-acetylglucosamine transferase (SPINDLY family)